MAILKGLKDRIDVKVTAVIEMDNGKDLPVPFVVTYKKPSITETLELEKLLKNEYDDEGNIVREAMSDIELAQTYILGWSGVPTETGEPYDFTPEHMAEMLEAREYLKALVTGMKQVIWGREAVMAKNSSRPGGRGP